jgi:transposase
MMGREGPLQSKLFYTEFNLEQRVRADHPLRQIASRIDFDFAYAALVDHYGSNGNVSVPPPIILKLMLLLVFYNVRSERELMSTLPERLDWLWFLGFDLDSPIPDHSVLSKARKRWGVEVFKQFFERIVWQCVTEGLVDGSKLFMDSSLIEANAANNSVVDTQSLQSQVNDRYRELERRLNDVESAPIAARGVVNRRYVSTTDPDAAIVTRGKSKLLYQTHRAVDSRAEIITAVEITRGDVNEAHRLIPLWEQHQSNTQRQAETVVADSKYGTVENFLACHDRGVAAHLPDLKRYTTQRVQGQGIFPNHRFNYDPSTDTYQCPSGQTLKRKSVHQARQSIDYAAAKQHCDACALRTRCTRNSAGRTITRHLRQQPLDEMRARSRSARSRYDLRIRKHLMERSFARATRFGFDRARWRGLWRVSIQEYLTAALQNIEVLMRYGGNPRRRLGVLMQKMKQWVPSIVTVRQPRGSYFHSVEITSLPTR